MKAETSAPFLYIFVLIFKNAIAEGNKIDISRVELNKHHAARNISK